jgi:hypothetical protein
MAGKQLKKKKKDKKNLKNRMGRKVSRWGKGARKRRRLVQQPWLVCMWVKCDGAGEGVRR